MYYFDNAATTKIKPDSVIAAVVDAMKNSGNASRGASDESLSADRIVFSCRRKINALFNGDGPKQVAFTKNSTEALNVALLGLIKEDDHVITTVTDHNSVLRPLNFLKISRNISLDYLGIDPEGHLLLDQLEDLKKANTRVLVANHISNVTGNINDLYRLGDFCKKEGIIFIVDGSQSAGAFNIDMEAMNIDVFCFTGHKSLYGPQGTGGLCVKKNISIDPLLYGGTGVQTYYELQPEEMPTRLEAGTLNSHGLAGLEAGLTYIKDQGMEKLTERAQKIAKNFYEGIKDLPSIKFFGDYSDFSKRAPIVSFNLGKIDSAYVSMVLADKYKISTRPGGHCAPLLHKSFKTVDQGMVRFSFSHFNTKEEVEIAIQAIREISKEEVGF
ncbi:aminotransferase class V-fold PLP-dependent enzyme [Neofamilia massiliensis]|uniref:aminotransferase class V-fold PLP-dependent enzyme n=1 Tax=Neofamilia massiliensis TaxID=1673724 RepID=UPI0006BB9852|nr:aminotransferase class V-fold PLP-dependent enzyme [Neofamilia massiliensis]